MSTLEMTRYLSYSIMLLSSAVLLYFMIVYVRFVVAETYRHGWWLLGTGAGAGMVYGLSGLLFEYYDLMVYDLFRQGASLFFVLFLALGIRAVAAIEPGTDSRKSNPDTGYGIDAGVIGLFVVAWWTAFAYGYRSWLTGTQSIGWTAMVLFALYFGVRAVKRHEGTSIASIIRHLLPAVVVYGCIVAVQVLSLTTGRWESLTEALWIVGVVLVSAFLFNTATTIRQQEAELHRIYDRTTW